MDSNVTYLKLITSEYANMPKYNAYVKTFLDMVSPAVDMLDSFNTIFKLSTATGDQLDKIGSIIGVGRVLPTDNVNIPPILPDGLYRTVLMSKIYSNQWNGTREGLESILDSVFPGMAYEIVDAQDMTYMVSIINPNSDQTSVALLTEGYILPKPSGVGVNYNIVERPLFGWDSNTQFVKGWDEAEWATN